MFILPGTYRLYIQLRPHIDVRHPSAGPVQHQQLRQLALWSPIPLRVLRHRPPTRRITLGRRLRTRSHPFGTCNASFWVGIGPYRRVSCVIALAQPAALRPRPQMRSQWQSSGQAWRQCRCLRRRGYCTRDHSPSISTPAMRRPRLQPLPRHTSRVPRHGSAGSNRTIPTPMRVPMPMPMAPTPVFCRRNPRLR